MFRRNLLLTCVKTLHGKRLKHEWIKPEGHNTNIQVYNCVTKTKVPLIVQNKDLVSWYTCGPTVYDSAHIGHASCYVKLDIIQRILRRHFKLNLITVMNITDIDDKIINRSTHLGVSPTELARKFEIEFWSDLRELNVRRPDVIVRVTEHVPQILGFIEKIINEGGAYVAGDGSVYFDLSKCDSYGKLAPNVGNLAVGMKEFEVDSSPGKPEESNGAFCGAKNQEVDMRRQSGEVFAGEEPCLGAPVSEAFSGEVKKTGRGFAREKPVRGQSPLKGQSEWGRRRPAPSLGTSKNQDASGKKSSEDFALWKCSKPEEPNWSSKWGAGRPGWHTECSALASAVFGGRVDVHAGGIDLRFPHHENEEAISCVYHQKEQWVNYWLHTGHLRLAGEASKMSKSLGGFVTIREMLTARHADSFRMACAMSHYRTGMEYGEELMQTAEILVHKFAVFLNECDAITSGALPLTDFDSTLLFTQISKTGEEIDAAYRDDFNTSRVVKSLTELIGTSNKMFRPPVPKKHPVTEDKRGSLKDCAAVASLAKFIREQLEILGFSSVVTAKDTQVVDDILANNFIDVLINFRQNVRNLGLQNKNSELLKHCDALRDELKMYGVQVQDRGKTSSWNRS